jgi:hypothetical protein
VTEIKYKNGSRKARRPTFINIYVHVVQFKSILFFADIKFIYFLKIS